MDQGQAVMPEVDEGKVAQRIAQDGTPVVRFNQVRHPSEALVKTARLQGGQMIKEPGAGIPAGCTVSTRECSLAEYVTDIHCAGVNQYALPSNAAIGSDVPLGPKGGVPAGGVDRSAKTFRYVEGPAVLTFDHDPSRYAAREIISPAELAELLAREFPAVFEDAAYAGYYSSSSFIVLPDGTPHSGAKGHHSAFAIPDASDAPRFSEVLFKRLWLLGYGYVFITRAGTMIPRTIFDAKVHEPQQPLFAGGMNCLDGIRQQRPAPVIVQGGYLDSKALPSLSPEEHRKYEEIVVAAKAASQGEAARVRREYQKVEVQKLTVTGMPEERARRTVESRLGGTLVGDDPLIFAKQGKVTVAEALASPEKYERCALHDPLEPEYGSDGTAIFFENSETNRPIVFSHAHGGRNYLLKYDEPSIKARLRRVDPTEAADLWKRLIVQACLDEDALERILKLVKEITGTGVIALRKAAKAALAAHRLASSHPTHDPALMLCKKVLDAYYEGGRLLLRTDSGAYYAYTGTHWAQVSENVITSEIQQVAEAYWNEVRTMYEDAHKEVPALSAVVASTLVVLGNKIHRPGDSLRFRSRRPALINMANGELWLEDSGPVLRPHDPGSYLTSCSSILYDRDAKAPSFEEALRGMLCLPGGVPMVDQDEMVRHVTELLGYCCQAQRFLKLFLLIVGPGDNGKTRLSKLIEHIIGPDAISFDRLSSMNEEGSRFAASRLVGKLVAIEDDADHQHLLPDGFLKKIAEEKPMTAERKFQDEFTFVAQVVVILLSNSWPRVKDLSRGIRTRAQVIHLPRSFKRVDECGPDDPDRQRPELWETVYSNELSGVVNEVVKGFYRVKERRGLMPPKSAQDAFEMWFSEANVVSRFISDTCDRVPGEKAGDTTGTLYLAFRAWADTNDVQKVHRPQQRTFGARIEELGYVVRHTNKGSAVFGLVLKPEWQTRADALRPFEEPAGEAGKAA